MIKTLKENLNIQMSEVRKSIPDLCNNFINLDEKFNKEKWEDRNFLDEKFDK
jgi:hypothetical protein